MTYKVFGGTYSVSQSPDRVDLCLCRSDSDACAIKVQFRRHWQAKVSKRRKMQKISQSRKAQCTSAYQVYQSINQSIHL